MPMVTAGALPRPAQAGLGIAARVTWAGPAQGAEALSQISVTSALLPCPDCGSGASQDFGTAWPFNAATFGSDQETL